MKNTYSQAQLLRAKTITKTIGDISNLLILYELINFGEKSFNELKRMTDTNAVTLSRKLHCLRDEGIVDFHVHGKENRYFVTKLGRTYEPLMKQIEALVVRST